MGQHYEGFKVQDKMIYTINEKYNETYKNNKNWIKQNLGEKNFRIKELDK